MSHPITTANPKPLRLLLSITLLCLLSVSWARAQLKLDDGGTITGSFTEILPGGPQPQSQSPLNVNLSKWDLSVQGTPLGAFTCSGTGTIVSGWNASNQQSSPTNCFGNMEEQYTPTGTTQPLNTVAFTVNNTPSLGTPSQANINLTWIAPNPPLENNFPSQSVTLPLVTKAGTPTCLGANNTPPQPTNYCSLVQWIDKNGHTFTYVIPPGASLTATESAGQIQYNLVIPGASGGQSSTSSITTWIVVGIIALLAIVLLWRRLRS